MHEIVNRKRFQVESVPKKMIALSMRDSIDIQRERDLKNNAKVILTQLQSLHHQVLTIKEKHIKAKLLPITGEK